MIKKIFVIFLIFLTSCEYKPIYKNKNLKKFEFSNIIKVGDLRINNKIINSLSLTENTLNPDLETLKIESNFQNLETSKDKKGLSSSFKTILDVNIVISKNEEVIRNKNFRKEFNYNSPENKFKLIEYQNDILQNQIREIIRDIVLFLN